MLGSEFHAFLVNFPKQVQKYLKLNSKTSKEDDRTTSSASTDSNDKDSSIAAKVNLEKQLQAWKENPIWVNSTPEVKVSVPKGSLCNLNVKVNIGLPPDAVYDIIIDPDNRRVFKNIKEVISRRVLVDEGLRQVVELEQAALWRFLWWSGTISVHVLVDQNREDHSMKFKQIKTGFMKRFEGHWKVEPILVDEQLCHSVGPKTLEEYDSCTKGKGRIASEVSLDQLIQPAIVPPPPFSWYLRGITAKTTEMIINDLVAEAARIKGFSTTEFSQVPLGSSEGSFDEGMLSYDIKERWALRRRNAKHSRRRLSDGS
ncbi:unnamed protein product [Coffea canephora]|uniref:DUF220 domain-containing protein n=2 Tax=Coffea TaxID=13442 RepID=A0A068TV53_COFCA|nr:uncharacterized protein LOC113715458 [Coffea arabica]XP_027095462.1 uncharacterized protein LOC113715458 [Coffea arabica]CDP00160.1 unnamed protein product [Coffea canephora]